MSNLKLGHTTQYDSEYNPQLIDVFPRSERRIGMNSLMYGVDIWTAYEFSFLQNNGLPYFCVLRIYNFAHSEDIFESKSLKLYLNSFNNTCFSGIAEVKKVIERDLSERVGSEVFVEKLNSFPRSKVEDKICLEKVCRNIEINEYKYNVKLLKSYRSGYTNQLLYSNLLRSNCEVTNQPDWGRVTIEYISTRKLDYESLLRYIVSFRKHQGFHEIVCERIYNDLYNELKPIHLSVLCQYTRRGGIDINPFRTSQSQFDLPLLPKLLQQ